MKPPEIIFLDVDDTLNRFTMSALSFLGCDVNPFNESQYDPAWEYDLLTAVTALLPGASIPEETFWNRFPRNFWANIPISAECGWLLTTCSKLVGKSNICLLTKPSGENDCLAGKADWIQRSMPGWLHDQYLIGAPKYFCANERSLLIDDSERNISAFARNGGQTILVPRPWNPLHKTINTVSYIASKLERIFDTDIAIP